MSVIYLMPTEFAALLERAGVSQAAFARMIGVAQSAVNHWCKGRTHVPRWAWLLANAVIQRQYNKLQALPAFAWHEVLGVDPTADADTIRRARNQLSRKIHPDLHRHKGEDMQHNLDEAMKRVNAAFELAKQR